MRWRVRRRAALALPALLLARPARPQPPAGSGVALLVGGPPGSGVDRWARGFAPFLERHIRQGQVNVLNRPGEGGLDAARAVADAAADGRLIGAVATPQLLARAVERGDAGLVRRLSFVAAVAEEPVLLVTAANGGIADLAELRALPAPSRIGTPPPGSAPHLAAALLGSHLELTPLAFPNAAAARQAVLAGNIPCAMLAGPEAIHGLRDGRLTALGIAREARTALLPEVATLREQGVPVTIAAERGFVLAPGAVAIQGSMERALRDAVADPEFQVQADAAGYLPHFIEGPVWTRNIEWSLERLARRWSSSPWREATSPR